MVRDGRHTVLAQAHGGCEGRHGSSVTEQTVGSVQRPQEVRRVDNPCTQCDPKTLDSFVQYIPSCRRKGKLYDHSVCSYNQRLACCTSVSRSRRPATALTAGQPPSYGKLGADGPESARDTHRGVCRLVTGRVRRRPCQAHHGYIYICNICGVPPIVADTSPVRKPPYGVDAPRSLPSSEAQWL